MEDDPTIENVKACFDAMVANCPEVPLSEISPEQVMESQRAVAKGQTVLERKLQGEALEKADP